MKRLETMEVIKKWCEDFCYSLKDITFTHSDSGRWIIIINLECITIILRETGELLEDIRLYFEAASLYSIDTLPDGEGMTLWIEI